MSGVICSCGNPSFPNLNRPNCVITMKAIAFPVLIPRYQADGVTRNTLDSAAASIGADIKTLLLTSTDAESRIYPFPRAENVNPNDRTDTVYETAASTRKYKIVGVGGVRTFTFELWDKDAVNQILRDLKKVGCTDVDFSLVDVAGNWWGIKDDVEDAEMRGFEMSTETFDAFKMYATDTTVQKIMVSWDLDNDECEENAYAITSEELLYKATTLRGNISGITSAVALTTLTAQVKVFSGFGSGGDRDDVVALLSANFQANNLTTPGVVVVTSLETAPGEYTLTFLAQTTNDVIQVDVINAAGYDVASTTFLAL